MPPKAQPAVATGLSERDVVALTLHHEASAEGRQGMLAVGCVLRNRRAWGKWGPTLRDVCLAHKQFSCWRPAGGVTNYTRLVNHAQAIRDGKRPAALQLAYDVAAAVLSAAQADITNGADHYYAPRAMKPVNRVPAWAANVPACAVIGGHIFFRLRPDAPLAPEVLA